MTEQEFRVFYIIKRDCHGYLQQDLVMGPDKQTAYKKLRARVKARTGRKAFSCTCTPPEVTQRGVKFNNCLYTQYSAVSNTLW